DQLTGILTGLGIDVVATRGTYFLTADPRPLGVTDAARWCLELPERVGVAAVPFSPFVDGFAGEWAHHERLAVCKRPEVLADAARWCLELPERVGVAAVPFSPFVDDFAGEWSHLVRFAFCKRPEVLAEAGRRLEALR